MNGDGTPRSTVASGSRSIGINTEGAPFTGIASTGDHLTVLHLPPGELRPPAEVDAPSPLANLPVRHPAFVGRTRELALLDQALSESGTAVVQALHGLGGVGKSALAAHWAATRADNPVWWITADSPVALDAGLADLARALQPALAQLPPEQLTERAVQWLAAHSGWLLVLDNVDDPSHVSRLLARATTGRVLITTRRATGWHDTAVPVPLDVLSPAESLELLTRVLTRPASRDGAAELCAELGHLPLAVEQAGAYIAQTGLTARAYLRLLADSPAELLHRTGEGRDPERTVARVWRLTLDRLADTPLAGTILGILAWYAPEQIPRGLLDPLGDPLGDPLAVHDAIGRLAAYSMVTVAEDGALTVHRLVQALARTADADDPHRRPEAVEAAREVATVLLGTALPAEVEEQTAWPAWWTLLPHVEALLQYTPPAADSRNTSRLLNSAGCFLLQHGQVRRALAYLERSSEHSARVLGPDHPDTLVFLAHLAQAHQHAGSLDHAVALYEQALDSQLRVLGPDDPQTLTVRNNLADAWQAVGAPERAVALLEQTLADRLRLLDPDHPRTLTTRNNLAKALHASGRSDRALPMFEQVLADRLRVLGPDHQDSFASRNNLASACRDTGDLLRALTLFRQNLDGLLRVLGPDHPHTLVARHNLAGVHLALGDPELARELYELNLTERLRVLGPEHPRTLDSRNNLAFAHRESGRVDLAVPLFEQVLDGQARLLGPDHPRTDQHRANLALACLEAGDHARAAALLEQVLDHRSRTLGPDRPDTVGIRIDLATAQHLAGDQERAAATLRQAWESSTRALGPDHPMTVELTRLLKP